MLIITAGVNYRTAPVEIREKLSFSENKLGMWLAKLNEYKGINGSVIISTCNRIEIYATTRDINKGKKILVQFMSQKSGVEESHIEKYMYIYCDLQQAVEHLFKVAAGIDSMVLGETQILGQVRRAYQIACEQNSSDKLLNTLFHKSINVGKRVRNETGIDKNPVSISYAAVELAKQIYGNLEGKKVLVVGAGKMSELTVKYLVSNGAAGVIVSNRSYNRALEMAEKFGGQAVRFNKLPEYLKKADIVISCTSASHYVIKHADILNALSEQQNKKMVMIDIAMPRDIEPSVAELEGVSLYDVDDLQNVVGHNLLQRKKAAEKGMDIIDNEVAQFVKWMSMQMAVPTITSLKELGESIKQKELTKAINRLGKISEYEQKVISTMANSIVNQLLHNPVIRLKEYNLSEEGPLYTEVLHNLFNLDKDENCRKKLVEENR